jgi:Uma2 family endonuclease
MYATTTKLLTFEEFLAWDDGSGRAFELLDGLPVPLSEPNANHEDLIERLCTYLEHHCQAHNLPYVARQSKQIWLRTEPDQPERSRKADIVVFDQAEWQRMKAIYQLENGEYLPGKLFRGQDLVASRLFPNLALTAEQIFAMSQ